MSQLGPQTTQTTTTSYTTTAQSAGPSTTTTTQFEAMSPRSQERIRLTSASEKTFTTSPPPQVASTSHEVRNVVHTHTESPRRIVARDSSRGGGVALDDLADVIVTDAGFLDDHNASETIQVESPRHGTGWTRNEEITITQQTLMDREVTYTEQAVENLEVRGQTYAASVGMNLNGVETSAVELLTPRGGHRGRLHHEDVIMSPRSAMEKKSGNFDASEMSLQEAIKRLPTLEQGATTEEHIHSDKHKKVTEKRLPDRIEYSTEEIAQKEAVRPIPSVREVVQTVEDIIKVPRIVQRTRQVVKEIPVERVIQKVVEVPKYVQRTVQKPVTVWVDEIVAIPKVRLIEDIIEVPVPVHRIEEVVEVVERLVPTFVTKHVKKPVEQYNDVIKVVERKKERTVEVPKYTYEKAVVEVPVVAIEEVVKYVEVPQIIEKINIIKKEQVQEEVIRRPVKKVMTTEVIREIPVVRTVIKEVQVDKIVEVPRRVEIPREVLVKREQICEVPRYLANVKHVYHHSGNEMIYRQKEIQLHKKRIVQYVGEQKQTTIKQKVLHVPKFVEVEVIEWIDLITERPVEVVREETIEVEKTIYEDVEEEIIVEKKRKKFVEIEQIQHVTKYVTVPQEQVVRVPKIVYTDNTQIMENIVEVPEIIYKDRIVEKIVDVFEDKYIEVAMVKTIPEYVEVPVIKRVEKIIEVPVIQYVETTVEVPEIRTITTYIDEVEVEEQIRYVDMKVDVIEEEIVEVPNEILVDMPELVMVDTEIFVPEIKKVGVIMEIDCEVHHDVIEETTQEINVDIERKEDILHDRIHVDEGELEPIIESEHIWDTSNIAIEHQHIVLPHFGEDGRTVEECNPNAALSISQ